MPRLSDREITEKLTGLTGWERREETIKKQFVFPSFMAAIAFVNRIADLAEVADHHPDIVINYKKVTLILTTHSAKGLTENDFTLATQIDGALS